MSCGLEHAPQSPQWATTEVPDVVVNDVSLCASYCRTSIASLLSNVSIVINGTLDDDASSLSSSCGSSCCWSGAEEDGAIVETLFSSDDGDVSADNMKVAEDIEVVVVAL